MRIVKIAALAAFATLLALSAILMAEEPANVWETDINAAKVKAEKENKDLLVFFLGDTDIPSLSFDKSILSKDEFKTEMSKKYILVRLEFKEAAFIPADQLKVMTDEALKAGLTNVPTMALMDIKGRIYGLCRKLEYEDAADGSQMKEFIEIVSKLQGVKVLRDFQFDKAAKLQGQDKINAINNGLFFVQKFSNVFDGQSLFGYDEEVNQIINADPNNKTPLVEEWEYRTAVVKARRFLFYKDSKAAFDVIEAFITSHPNNKALKQRVIYHKAQMYAINGDGELCLKTLLEVIEMDPDSDIGKEAKQIIEEVKKDK